MVFGSLARLQGRILALGRTSAEERLSAFLLELRPLREGSDVVRLAMPRRDIADYLVLSVETVSRTLTLFRERGWIRFADVRRVHLVDRIALEQLTMRQPG
jgi:CRP/FNR family transcriptional regulator, nitrogen fixation regulation protein